MASYLFFLSLLISLSSFITTTFSYGSIGINYGRVADNLPSPTQVVQLLKSQGLTRVKLYDTDSTVLTALSGSGIYVTVALPNEHLQSAASSQSNTDTWVQSNIINFYPKTLIETITVGNEVFVDPRNTTSYLVPAMKNMYASLVKFNVSSNIKVSSPIALSALENSYPSSSGSFKPELIEPVIKPMLRFLKETRSYLMVNAYPFFAYIANTDTVSLEYALFRANKGVTDPKNGLVYKSLLEAQVDAVYAAMGSLGFDDVKIVVSETGWPSKGDENEVGANEANAAGYNGNLVKRVLTGNGSPLRPNEALNVFLFGLFNENEKTGPTSERNYGLFYPDEKKVYEIPLTIRGLKEGQSGSKGDVGGAPPANGGRTWCVANEKAGNEKLEKAFEYACGEGGADCGPIEKGGVCHEPDSLSAHASYAFNTYYQNNARKTGTCYFGGAAYVVTQPPKFGHCEFSSAN